MTEDIVEVPYSDEEVSDDDKLWALLSWMPWVGWVLAIIALLVDPQKDRPFTRFHAVQAIAANVIIGIISGLTFWTVCIPIVLGLVTIYPAIKAYQGEWLELPWLTQFCKSQGWI